MDYLIVGSFVVQDETTESISEALSILREWNPNWQPRNFMTDLCDEEINSLESIFPGTVRYMLTHVKSKANCKVHVNTCEKQS